MPHTMCLETSRESHVMDLSTGSTHPEVQPLDSCKEVIPSAIARLATSCVMSDRPLFPNPPKTRRLR